jgi:PIN domain nuclease of toxin-antitoxin system
VLWWLQNSRKLSTRSRAKIKAASAVYVSSVSIWEAAIKVNNRLFEFDLDEFTRQIKLDGFLELQVSYRHAVMVALLPRIHRDPFDRMLVAQAMCESMRLFTVDRVLVDYSDLVELI